MPSNSRHQWIRGYLTALLFIFPWVIGFVLLVAFPFAASFVWSFCSYDMLSPPQFVGAENYQRLGSELVGGGKFGMALWNTAYYAFVSVPLSILLGIGLAVMLSWNVRGQAVYRTLFFLPSVVPVIAASVLWMWLLDPSSGLVNHLLGYLGIPPQNWFKGVGEIAWPGNWGTAQGGLGSKDGLALMSLWGVGNFMIIYLAALGDIPGALYEAAALDGAGRWARLRHVTLPMLSPVIFFNLVMGLIQSVQAFTQVYIVSEGTGEPAGTSLLVSLHLFLSSFKDLDMGYASAMAWIMFVVLVTATWLLFRTARHWVHYQGSLR